MFMPMNFYSYYTCANRVSLFDRLPLRTELHRHFNATSFVPPYYPYEARIPRIGCCSNDLEACSSDMMESKLILVVK